MLTIIFESHGTTWDNEAHRASGHANVALSPLGEEQAEELGQRYKPEDFVAIFCSDLQRSYKTAELAFPNAHNIVRDARLRECDYGDFTQMPSKQVDAEKSKRMTTPFPNGESYEQTTARMKSFLHDALQQYDGKKIMVIGHRATQYGLEHLINGIPLATVIAAPWKWQPGWKYQMDNQTFS